MGECGDDTCFPATRGGVKSRYGRLHCVRYSVERLVSVVFGCPFITCPNVCKEDFTADTAGLSMPKSRAFQCLRLRMEQVGASRA